MENMIPPNHKDNLPDRKRNARVLFFLLVGCIALFGLLVLYKYLKSIIPPPAQIAVKTCYYVSPNADLVSTSMPITLNKPLPGLIATSVTGSEATPVGQFYYVSADGEDGNPGTLDRPWKTISFAAKQLQAGDSLFIRGGIYQEHVDFENSGTSESPILISSFGDEEAIIDGNGNALPGANTGIPLVLIRGDWVDLKNVTIQYSGDMGVLVQGEHVTLDNLYVHHSWSSGVILTGDHDLIQNSRIWYNATINENGRSTTGWGAGVSCARYPDYCTIRTTVSWENWGEGISTFEALHSTIERNFSYDNQQNYYISDTKYSILQGNFSYCSTGNSIDSYETQNGILVGDEKGVPIPLAAGSARYPSSDNKILNNIVIGCNHNLAAGTDQSSNNLYAFNTFVNSSGSTGEKYNIIFYRGQAVNARFTNNIIVQEDSRSIAIIGGSGILFSNNLWSKKPPKNATGLGDIIGDPLLKKRGLPYTPGWFELTEDSPARNVAAFIPEVAWDFFGNSRGANSDIGAIQYISP